MEEYNLDTNEKRTRIVSVRVSLDEERAIALKAHQAKQSISTFMRNVSLNQKVMTRLNDEERNMVRQLIGMSNNLNQLAKNSHTQNLLTLAQAIIETLGKINVLLNKLQISNIYFKLSQSFIEKEIEIIHRLDSCN